MAGKSALRLTLLISVVSLIAAFGCARASQTSEAQSDQPTPAGPASTTQVPQAASSPPQLSVEPALTLISTPVISPTPPTSVATEEEPTVSEANTFQWQVYIDESSGFKLKYPASFGAPTVGTSRDFPEGDDRGISLRFPQVSSGLHGGKLILEGEVVVTVGRIWVVGQALGGLHDAILMGGIATVLPTPFQDDVLAHVSTLDITNFCEELEAQEHFSRSAPSFASINSEQQKAIMTIDKTRNLDPVVVRCDIASDTATFEKVATFESGGVVDRQHIHGAIRFLEPPFSSIQFVRITTENPSDQLLADMTAILDTFEALSGSK